MNKTGIIAVPSAFPTDGERKWSQCSEAPRGCQVVKMEVWGTTMLRSPCWHSPSGFQLIHRRPGPREMPLQIFLTPKCSHSPKA